MPKKDDKAEEIQENIDIEETVAPSEETELPETETEAVNETVTDPKSEITDSPDTAGDELLNTGSNDDENISALETNETVTVQPVQFASFEDLNQVQGEINKNLEILMDIKLQMTVELGRTELPVKKVLELTRGSIIELEKVAGEPVELYANGKLVAHGEVVVIEDNFGLRITSITEPEDRLKGL